MATDDGGSVRFESPQHPTPRCPGLDAKTQALMRLAALVATGGATTSYRTHVASALAAGATGDDVVGTLAVVARTIGSAQLVAATVGLALGLGYDIEAAFEGVERRGLQRPDDPEQRS